MSQPDDDPPIDPDKNTENSLRNVNFRLDPEHYAALVRVAGFEKLRVTDTLRKLIRIADQAVMGAESPFASRLEHLLTRKAG